MFQYETPTQKFFNKLESDKKQQQEIALKKENELSEIEMSFKGLVANTKPLCSNCHTSGHNKTMCSFSACLSTTICKDIKKHSNEERYHKSLQAELKTTKTKFKKLDEDFASRTNVLPLV